MKIRQLNKPFTEAVEIGAGVRVSSVKWLRIRIIWRTDIVLWGVIWSVCRICLRVRTVATVCCCGAGDWWNLYVCRTGCALLMSIFGNRIFWSLKWVQRRFCDLVIVTVSKIKFLRTEKWRADRDQNIYEFPVHIFTFTKILKIHTIRYFFYVKILLQNGPFSRSYSIAGEVLISIG